MITLTLDAGDIRRIVELLKKRYHADELSKVDNIRFTPENFLAFEQRFALATTVNLHLSCDERGRIIIEVVRLAANPLAHLILKHFHRIITGIIAGFAGEVLMRDSDSRLILDLQQICPLPGRIDRLAIAGGVMTVCFELADHCPSSSRAEA